MKRFLAAVLHKNTITIHLVFFACFGYFLWLSLVIQGGLNAFPDHIHAWTQSDRLAIAENYATYQLNPAFPGSLNLNPALENVKQHGSNISAMDIPLIEYISGMFMRLSGDHSAFWFRLFQLLAGLAGAFALFRLLLDKGIEAFALLPVMLLACSPMWLYYAVGFIPSISAISCSLIAIYLFFEKQKFLPALLMAVVAGLIRTPLLIVFFSLVLALYLEKIAFKRIIIWLCISASVFLSWYCWKLYLQQQYGTMFLTSLMPAENLQELFEICLESIKRWWHQLWVLPAWIFVLILSFVRLFVQGTETGKKLFITGLVGIIGGGLYFVLMVRQFSHHDYYYLDAFFVPLVLMVAGISADLGAYFEAKWQRATAFFGVIFLLGISVNGVSQALEERVVVGTWDRYHQSLENFSGGDALLDSMGIKPTEPILVIDAYSTNAPLLLFRRQGYTILNTVREELKKAAVIPVKYAVIQDFFLRTDVTRVLPEIVNDWERIGGNGRISVFKRSAKQRSETEFAGLTNVPILYKAGEKKDSLWANILEDFTASNEFSGEFGPTFRMPVKQGAQVLVWADFELSAETPDAGLNLVFRLHGKDAMKVWQYSLNDYTDILNDYPFNCMVPIEVEEGFTELEFFIYNPSKVHTSVKINDFKVFDRSPE